MTTGRSGGRRRGRPALALAAVLVLSGCVALSRVPAGSCPRASVLADAGEMTRFKPGPGQDLIDVVFEAEIAGVAVTCEDVRSDGLVAVVSLGLVTSRGPAATGRVAEVPFFVAYVDRAGKIRDKAVFSSRVEFPAGRPKVAVREDIELDIPLSATDSPADLAIVVGLQLTRQELERNRARRR